MSVAEGRVTVLSPGPLTTVQDAGREGWRHLGVARAGALDPAAAWLANRLVGNPIVGSSPVENQGDDAVLELTLAGPTLRLDTSARIAVCGAPVRMRFEPDQGEAIALPGGRPIDLPPGVLRLGAVDEGVRAWLAVAGGLAVPRVLGSRSTDLRGGFGGLAGRALQAGDCLRTLRAPPPACTRPRVPRWWIDSRMDDHDRIPAGSEVPIRFVPSAISDTGALLRQRWQASARSDRQGLRLDGEPLQLRTEEQVSAPVAPGTVQLPPDGRPIVLLADAQTVGGYPRLGHVAAVDLPRLAQLRPGQPVRLIACDAQTATQLACAARHRLARISLMIQDQLDRGRVE